jgi:hypothetical protein
MHCEFPHQYSLARKESHRFQRTNPPKNDWEQIIFASKFQAEVMCTSFASPSVSRAGANPTSKLGLSDGSGR